MAGIATMHMIHEYFSCPVNYINCIFNLLCRFYPAKEAKLFEYAKEPPPDIAKFDSMGDRSSTYENEIPITNSISYC